MYENGMENIEIFNALCELARKETTNFKAVYYFCSEKLE